MNVSEYYEDATYAVKISILISYLRCLSTKDTVPDENKTDNRKAEKIFMI